MKLVFLHGWGLDASLWDAVRAALPEFDTIAWERGYFGSVTQDQPGGPFLAVGHSLGSMLLALDPPDGCVGLIAINGFDWFVGPERVPERIVARMQSQFRVAPERVLADFRARIGAGETSVKGNTERLAADLTLLARGGANHRSVDFVRLVLHGADDPLLPPEMRAQVFPGAARFTHPGAGHLLPSTHPHWCAEQVRQVMACA